MASVKSINSQTSFGRKPISMDAVNAFKEQLAKQGKKLSTADSSYIAKRLTEDAMIKEAPKPFKFLRAIANNDGEVQNTLLNTVFTSTLAPAVIFINPFVKKTQDEKLKTAFRQPVSALTALSFSFTATSIIQKALAKAANSGFIPSYDLRMSPSEELIKSEFKKGLKAAQKLDKKNNTTSAVAEFYKKCTPEGLNMDLVKHFEDKKGVQKIYMNQFGENLRAGRKQVFEALMEAKPDSIDYTDIAKGSIKVNKKVLDLKNIPNMTKESIEKFVKKYNVHNLGDKVNVKDSKAVKKYIEETMKSAPEAFKNLKKMVSPALGVPVAVGACIILNAIYPPLLKVCIDPLRKLFHVQPNTSVEGGNK